MASLIAEHELIQDMVKSLRIAITTHSSERQIIVGQMMCRRNAAGPRSSIPPPMNSNVAGRALANFIVKKLYSLCSFRRRPACSHCGRPSGNTFS
jgi:hypothetical protein